MSITSPNFNSYIDTKKYSTDETKNNSIKQNLKTALSDGKLTFDEIKNLQKEFGSDTKNFEQALKDTISEKGFKVYQEYKSSPSNFSFDFSKNGEHDDKVSVKFKTNQFTSKDLSVIDIGVKPTKEDYQNANNDIKSIKDKVKDGVVKTGNNNSVNYISHPKNTQKQQDVKNLQESLGINKDGLIGPKTISTLLKKYESLSASNDKSGLENLNKLVDAIGLKDMFKGTKTGASLESLYNKANLQVKVIAPEKAQISKDLAKDLMNKYSSGVEGALITNKEEVAKKVTQDISKLSIPQLKELKTQVGQLSTTKMDGTQAVIISAIDAEISKREKDSQPVSAKDLVNKYSPIAKLTNKEDLAKQITQDISKLSIPQLKELKTKVGQVMTTSMDGTQKAITNAIDAEISRREKDSQTVSAQVIIDKYSPSFANVAVGTTKDETLKSISTDISKLSNQALKDLKTQMHQLTTVDNKGASEAKKAINSAIDAEISKRNASGIVNMYLPSFLKVSVGIGMDKEDALKCIAKDVSKFSDQELIELKAQTKQLKGYAGSEFTDSKNAVLASIEAEIYNRKNKGVVTDTTDVSGDIT